MYKIFDVEIFQHDVVKQKFDVIWQIRKKKYFWQLENRWLSRKFIAIVYIQNEECHPVDKYMRRDAAKLVSSKKKKNLQRMLY